MICNACQNDDGFSEEDGFFYCKLCDRQVEGIIKTAVDPEDLVGDGIYQPKNTRRRRRVTPPYPEPVKSHGDNYKEMRDRYTKGLLMMITYQCDALVEEFNVTPLIIGLVGPICLRFVSLSGVFDDGWADKTILDSEIQSKGEAREPEVKKRKGEVREPPDVKKRKAEEHYNVYGKRAVTIWLSQLKKSLPLSSSLAISFLACHIAGAPVLPTDIVRWARQGKIPYLSSFLKIRKQMRETSAACPVSASLMFRPVQIVSAQRLEAQAASIADIIGLLLPPVNFYGIASNYLKRLSIPEDKVLDLVCLIKNWSMPSDLYLSKNELRLPTRVCVMSILIVAIRILYNINGFGVWERSLSLLDASEADAELSKATDFNTEELLKNLEKKYYEVAAETVGSFSYLLHGKNEMVTGLVEASADDTYKTADYLWNSYPKDEEFERFETLSKRGRDWEDDKLRDGNHPCTSHSRKTETESTDCDEPPSLEEKSKDRTIRKLITDMGENLFRYLPPRVKVKRLDYLQYVRKKDDLELIYAAHADYFILLRVCAIVAEIDVRNMHRAVLSFERRLGWIEKRIDHVLHLSPPILGRESRDT